MLIFLAARNSASLICISSRKDVAGVEGNSSECGVADGARLLVNFLEHEVLETALFSHDRVPGDVLHLALDGRPSNPSVPLRPE